MTSKSLVALVLAISTSGGAIGTQAGAPFGASKIGTPGPGRGDGHLLPGWSDENLKKRADAIQVQARDAELRARSILHELDQAFVALEAGQPKVSISRKISELEYQMVGLRSSLSEIDGLLASTPAPSMWDFTFLRGLRSSINEVNSEMLVNRVYFERQQARARLRGEQRSQRP